MYRVATGLDGLDVAPLRVACSYDGAVPGSAPDCEDLPAR